jgi:hypothetical protein
VKDIKLEKQKIIFENNKNNAILIKASVNDSAESILRVLQFDSLKPTSIILVFGGASNNIHTSDTSNTIINQIIDDILQYASKSNAIIIDGGTKAGIMEMIGQRVSCFKQSKKPIILGIAPLGLISFSKETKQNKNLEDRHGKALLEPNHSHFVLVEGNRWGDETSKLFEIAITLTHVDTSIVALLVGGGEISKQEIFFCIEQNLPIIIIEKTGYLADEIAFYKNQNQSFGKLPSDPDIKTIISYPYLKLFSSNSTKNSFKQFLIDILNNK